MSNKKTKNIDKSTINSTDSKLIKSIENHINDNVLLKLKFNHHNQKYKINELLNCIIIILKTGISYRNISNITTINWNTIYKFHCKLIKYNIFEDTYEKCVNKYLIELNINAHHLNTDTTFICNKLGIEDASFNQQIKKHKTTKISIISDDFNIPISVVTSTGSVHDSVILNKQLDKLHDKHPTIFNNKNILLADAAYDSLILREKVKNLNMGILLTNKNIRNSKKEVTKFTLYEKLLLNKRVNVEHTINKYKQVKRCQLRYDKYIKTYNSFVFLASLRILINKTNIYLN
jgi:hypothetical protein